MNVLGFTLTLLPKYINGWGIKAVSSVTGICGIDVLK
jgi:hypothetical protein